MLLLLLFLLLLLLLLRVCVIVVAAAVVIIAADVCCVHCMRACAHVCCMREVGMCWKMVWYGRWDGIEYCFYFHINSDLVVGELKV